MYSYEQCITNQECIPVSSSAVISIRGIEEGLSVDWPKRFVKKTKIHGLLRRVVSQVAGFPGRLYISPLDYYRIESQIFCVGDIHKLPDDAASTLIKVKENATLPEDSLHYHLDYRFEMKLIPSLNA